MGRRHVPKSLKQGKDVVETYRLLPIGCFYFMAVGGHVCDSGDDPVTIATRRKVLKRDQL